MATALDRTWKHRWLCIRKSDAKLFGAAVIEDALAAAASGVFEVYDTREARWIKPSGDYRDEPLPDVKDA